MTRIGWRRAFGLVAWLGVLSNMACHSRPASEPQLARAGSDSQRSSAANRHITALSSTRGGADTLTAAPVRSELERVQLAPAVHQIARLRGWPPPSTLTVDEVAPHELRQWLSAELDEQVPKSVTNLQDHGLSLIGVLPHGFHSSEAVLDAFAETIQGAYLTSRSRIALRRGLVPDDVRSVLSHEVVHAYQDQLYGLGGDLRFRPRHGDTVAALHALAEGEAAHVEREVGRTDLGSDEVNFSDERFEAQLDHVTSNLELPRVVARSLIAPYRDGHRFVSYLRRVGRWELVDAVWRRGVANTAEVLHPERWIDSNLGLAPAPNASLPIASRLPTLQKPAEVIWEEVLGEQGLRILLEEVESPQKAAVLASSWRDDTIWLSRTAAGERLAWHLRADQGSEARALEHALRGLLQRSPRSPSTCVSTAAANVAVMAQNRDILVVASGQVDTGAGPRPRIACRHLLSWGLEALTQLSISTRN